eukprot:12958841-Alexandrium_andersonii.AAC.1
MSAVGAAAAGEEWSIQAEAPWGVEGAGNGGDAAPPVEASCGAAAAPAPATVESSGRSHALMPGHARVPFPVRTREKL